jgi:hypothetical protein
MPKIVITHKVVDVERWLKFKAERADSLTPFGTGVTDHVALDGSNNIAVTADVHDWAGMQAAMSSPPPELAAAMERHGVIPPLAVYIEKWSHRAGAEGPLPPRLIRGGHVNLCADWARLPAVASASCSPASS